MSLLKLTLNLIPKPWLYPFAVAKIPKPFENLSLTLTKPYAYTVQPKPWLCPFEVANPKPKTNPTKNVVTHGGKAVMAEFVEKPPLKSNTLILPIT